MTKIAELKQQEKEQWDKLQAIEGQANAIRIIWQPIYNALRIEEMKEQVRAELRAETATAESAD